MSFMSEAPPAAETGMEGEEPVVEEAAPSEEEVRIEGLANALEELIAAHGERGLECAPAYCAYARALLCKAQAESDPFGGAMKKEKEEGGGSAEDDDDDEEGEGEEESDDLELAFQCLEVARLIYENAGESHGMALAGVLESLGEVAMENEMWEDAIQELDASLTIKSKLLPPADRELAHLHYQLATAAVARVEKARHDASQPVSIPLPDADPPPTPEACAAAIATYQAKAVAHYGHAASVLEQHLAGMRAKEGGEESEGVAEVAELLGEVRAKVEEVSQLASGSADGEGSASVGAPSANDAAAGSGAEAAGSTTTIGFGAPPPKTASGKMPLETTTIGFGNAPAAPAASSGFAAPTTAAVKDLGVVGRGAKRIRLD